MPAMALPKRSDLRPGLPVQIVEKHNQRTGALSEGVIARILTKSAMHPHGIKVMLEDGRVGRVRAIVGMGAVTADPGPQIPDR